VLLSDDERGKIREFEILKNEIRQELHPEARKSRISQIFQHQAVLLLLGFLFTTGVGSWFTFYWKQRDWKNEQSYLAQQRSLDKKYAVIEEAFRDVAVTTTAAQDILATYYGENKWTAKDIQERKNNWYKTSRDWRVGSKVLGENLDVTFTNNEIRNNFQHIVDKRRQLGNVITNLPTGRADDKSAKSVEKQVEDANTIANEILNLLYECGRLMIEETKTIPAY
jgi:hypothetical protein